jgi:hypothetical protein
LAEAAENHVGNIISAVGAASQKVHVEVIAQRKMHGHVERIFIKDSSVSAGVFRSASSERSRVGRVAAVVGRSVLAED